MVRALVRKLLGTGGAAVDASGAEDRSVGTACFTVLDLEMTGLDPAKDSIVSVGAVRMLGGRILLGHTYEALVRPQSRMRHESIVIHEITPDDAEQGRDMAQVLPEFLFFCEQSVLVGWNVAMDHAFLSREAGRQGVTLQAKFLDAAQLCRSMRSRPGHIPSALKGLPDRDPDLFELASHLGIEVRVVHNALSDAYITAQVFQRLLASLASGGSQAMSLPLSSLLSAGNPFSMRGQGGHTSSFTF